MRPTPAKVREALFNILRTRLTGASFLELYAGTGAVGRDALAQGAREVVWVEKNPLFLRREREKTASDGADGGQVVGGDVHRFLRGSSTRYDIVFADPPYYTGELEQLMTSLAAFPAVSPGGILVLEHADRVTVPERAGNLCRVRSYRYGDTRLTVYEMREEDEQRDTERYKEVDHE